MDTGDTSQVCCCFSKDTQECPNPLDYDYYDSIGVKNGAKPVMVSIFAHKAVFYLGSLVVMGRTPFYRTSIELEHHFSNIERIRTCSSIDDPTRTL